MYVLVRRSINFGTLSLVNTTQRCCPVHDGPCAFDGDLHLARRGGEGLLEREHSLLERAEIGDGGCRADGAALVDVTEVHRVEVLQDARHGRGDLARLAEVCLPSQSGLVSHRPQSEQVRDEEENDEDEQDRDRRRDIGQ